MMNISVFEEVANLCLDGLINKSLNNTRLILDIFLDLLIDLVEERRERAKECRFKNSNILDKIFHVSGAVADSETEHYCITVAYLFSDMGQWHVAQINIIRSELKSEIVLGYLARKKIEMSQHRSFWFTSRARSDSEEQNTVKFWFLLLKIWYVSTFSDQVRKIEQL